MRLQISQGEYTVFSDDIFVGFRALVKSGQFSDSIMYLLH